ncbi:MAG: hypothetical protein HQM12_11195 [SAR324 cluster bacterium]|nr:hypothetical protein [SAR324 cluster bacterium]
MNVRYDELRDIYKKRRFWMLVFVALSAWLFFPVLFWFWYRRRLKEWKAVKSLETQMKNFKQQRTSKFFWQKWIHKKNRVRSSSFEELIRFYKTLIETARQYNLRIDLFDYLLDRKNRQLDPPFRVEELEQIELTFQRIYDELRSALNLLDIAERNPDVDLVSLLKDKYESSHESADYIAQTADLAGSGELIQELLLLETELHREMKNLAQ